MADVWSAYHVNTAIPHIYKHIVNTSGKAGGILVSGIILLLELRITTQMKLGIYEDCIEYCTAVIAISVFSLPRKNYRSLI